MLVAAVTSLKAQHIMHFAGNTKIWQVFWLHSGVADAKMRLESCLGHLLCEGMSQHQHFGESRWQTTRLCHLEQAACDLWTIENIVFTELAFLFLAAFLRLASKASPLGAPCEGANVTENLSQLAPLACAC